MLAEHIVIFVGIAALGAAVQSITGFAMGLIVMGLVTLAGILDIAFSAAVVSIISLVNTVIALRRTWRNVDRYFWLPMIAGLLPMTAVGVFLLEYLSDTWYELLKVMLGMTIVAGGVLLMAQPTPFRTTSPSYLITAMGSLGGIIGGMFGAGGAPLAWLMYRQPLALDIVRATLLATFFASTLGRLVVVTAAGEMTRDILLLAAITIPVVIVATIVATRFADRIPDRFVRRAVFLLLIVMGVSLVGAGLSAEGIL